MLVAGLPIRSGQKKINIGKNQIIKIQKIVLKTGKCSDKHRTEYVMTLPINYVSRMKNLVRFSVLLVFLISFAGCESEPVTDIAKIEKELKAVVKDNGITKCSVVERGNNYQASEVFYNADFTISNGSIIIHGENYLGATSEKRYNLLQLTSYDFSGNYIYFYF